MIASNEKSRYLIRNEPCEAAMKISVAVAAMLFCAPLAVQAQSLSADELVTMLRPSATGPTRGIRALSGPASAPMASAAAAAPARPATTVRPVAVSAHAAAPPAQPVEQSGQANLTVQFENGSDRLTPAATHVLDELGRALASPQLASYKFRIIGHTDSVGSRDANLALSERRANAVTAYIASRYNVDRSRLTALGMGQAEPLVPVADGMPEARNRRVQVINTGT